MNSKIWNSIEVIMSIQITKKITNISTIVNQIIKGDTIETLNLLPSNSVDMIFADPPYFMQSTDNVLYRADGTGEYKGCDDEWDKYKNFEEYDEFSLAWLKECQRVLKNGGTFWVIGSFQNIYRLGYHIQNLGFWILNDIIWNKTNPTPNMGGTRFCNAHETLLWCTKYKNSGYTFNYKTMKELNGGKQDRSVWTLSICQGEERLKDEQGNKLHNTQKPIALLEKIILSSTRPNDIVLDPFFGTGTTGAAAKEYGRNYIGIEREEKYIVGAEKRLREQIVQCSMFSDLSLETKPPKVTIRQLIERKYLYVNQDLFDSSGNSVCKLNADGTVSDGTETLSIHKMSAKILGVTNNNGWGFFYVRYRDKFICIDKLRYMYKENEK